MDRDDNGQLLTVLIVERHRTVAQSLARVVEDMGSARVEATVSDAESAIAIARKLAPDVALVDLELSPNCSLVAGLRSMTPDTRVIVLAERDSDHKETMVNALAAGAVGAIYKETSIEELSRALVHSSSSAPVVADEAAGLLLNSYLEAFKDKRRRDIATIEALAAAVEVRDLVTGRHLDRVTKLAQECMRGVDSALAANEEVVYGFTLHDIGKIGVPDSILKKPGPLDEDEWAVMRQHPEMGFKIVEPLGFCDSTTDVILCHHERWDGTGYPNQLKKDEIPLPARVFSVADAFDAMTSDRPYRKAMRHREALSIVAEEAGRAYDPNVVDLFLGANASAA